MININNVYDTTLTLLNKEQRGYVTPDEFNHIAGIVQNEVFEGYFQKAAGPENMDSELANIGRQMKEKLMPFISVQTSEYDNGGIAGAYVPTNIDSEYRLLGFHPIYENTTIALEADRMSHMEALKVELSPLTRPTQVNPVAVVQGVAQGNILEPDNTQNTYTAYRIIPEPQIVNIHYIREPRVPNWIGTTLNGQIVPDVTNEQYANFDLHESDYSEVVARVLGYFGLNVRDPEVIQTAGIKQQENNVI